MRELSPTDFIPSGGSRNQTEPIALLLDQQTRWKGGQRVLVEIYLTQQPALTANVEAVLDLIGNEVLLRKELGEKPVLAEYLQRFPHLAEPLKIQFEIEGALESAAGSQPTEGPRASDIPP